MKIKLQNAVSKNISILDISINTIPKYWIINLKRKIKINKSKISFLLFHASIILVFKES